MKEEQENVREEEEEEEDQEKAFSDGKCFDEQCY